MPVARLDCVLDCQSCADECVQQVSQRMELSRKFLPQSPHDLFSGPMVSVQANQNLRIAGPNYSGIAVGQIDTRVRQSDVIQYGRNLAWTEILMEKLLYVGAKASRFLHTKARSASQVQPDETGVNRGKEIRMTRRGTGRPAGAPEAAR